MLRRHASLVIAISLLALVLTACLVRTSSRPRHRQGAQPVYVEKHKKHKHKKVKHKKHKR